MMIMTLTSFHCVWIKPSEYSQIQQARASDILFIGRPGLASQTCPYKDHYVTSR